MTTDQQADAGEIYHLMGRPMSIKSLEMKKILPVGAFVSGERLPMRQEDFYGFWLTQHRKKIHFCRARVFQDCADNELLLDQTFFNLAQALYDNHPEVVEENNN